MRARLMDLAELTELDLARWRDLAERALEPNPFHEPEYVLPLAQGLGQLRDTQILVVGGAGAWQACLPVHAGIWHRMPLPSLSTWRGHVLYGLLGTPLVGPDHGHAALAALVQAMLTTRRVAFAALDWISEDGPVAEALAEVLERGGPDAMCFERFERAALRRRPEPTYLESRLSSKRRREFRRQQRKLGEALGAEPETVDRAGEESACDELIAMEAGGDKGERGTVLAADPGHVSFFRDMCRGFAEQGRLQLLNLQVGEHTVASKCNLVAGDTIFCFKIAYDERWSAFSPGILLELDTLKLFHERSKANLMDSCADPNNAMINRLWPDRRRLASCAMRTSGAAGQVAAPVLRAARSARDYRNLRRMR